MKRIFIDGSAGTTGLRIYERLGSRDDIELFILPDDKRKDDAARKEALNSADVAFLCLPDDAARQAVSMIENPNTVVIDTSTAHRTNPDWAYGFPELSKAHEEKIKIPSVSQYLDVTQAVLSHSYIRLLRRVFLIEAQPLLVFR